MIHRALALGQPLSSGIPSVPSPPGASFGILLVLFQLHPKPHQSAVVYDLSPPKLVLEFADVTVLRWDLEVLRS